MDKVILRQEKVTIPTYEISAYDKNPMFLEKRVYQGSSGRVYPHPVCEGVSDVKTNKEYNAIFLENDYILVMLLPEIGGKVQRLYDKTNGYDAVYYNEVVKPALVGLAGPWISGGIEFNWPQHHRPSTFDAVDYTIKENENGSVTVWMGETEKMFHTKGMAGFTVYPDKAYLEIRGQVYNPTDRPQTFLWWANPAVAVNDDTQSIFPPDVCAVMDHGKRDVSRFPIADGVYYKVDYAPGTDISRYKNIPVPTSYMAYHSDYNFIGNYDYGKQAGLLHVADHHISPGKKQWTWGNGDFGRAWDRNLTDENGPYIELMTGVFTDNQPDFTFLKPYEEKSFVQYFMPYKGAGAVKNASTEVVINLECREGEADIAVYAPVKLQDATLELKYAGTAVFSETVSLKAAETFAKSVPMPSGADKRKLRLSVFKDKKEILFYTPQEQSEDIPSPAEALPKPQQLETTEKLFLAAVHLEQYRHASRSPEPYYLEGLKRDGSDIRLNNGYGKYLYNKGCFAASERYFRTAAASSVWKNPNPYDCEPYYNLGLALQRQGRIDEAFDMFYKAVWDGNMQDKAFYRLACIAAGRKNYEEALGYVEKSLVKGMHNCKARTVKCALLRHLKRADEAAAFAAASREADPLDHGAYYEAYMREYASAYRPEGGKTKEKFDELAAVMRGDNHNYIELALTYMQAGFIDDAIRILGFAPNKNEPMVHYYLYALTRGGKELEAAEEADGTYCFPNRLEDMQVLEHAAQNGGSHASYYLGCLLYDKGRWQEAKEAWESCAEKIGLATVYSNLSLVYYNKQKDREKARAALEKAFSMNEEDARVFFELDQLYKALNCPISLRLDNMNAHKELLERRDDLYTEYITLLNLNGEYEKAYNLIAEHTFHPWEGGEGKIPAQYRISLINMAKNADEETAVRYLERALVYPENLGEGKLVGNMDNDIYYMLGGLYQDKEKAEAAYRLAARGDFSLSPAMYYNDQPPQMMYYAAKAMEAMGDANREEARRRFRAFVDYGTTHINDTVELDYFAVSLPDFLIFEGDLDKNNRVNCCLMSALGYMGLGDKNAAKEWAERGLKENCCHGELVGIMKELAHEEN